MTQFDERNSGSADPDPNVESVPSAIVRSKTEKLGPVLTGFGALYLVLAVSQAILEPSFRILPIVLLASFTSVIFIFGRFMISRYELSPRVTESLGSIFAGLVVVNGVVHFYLISGFTETRSLALLAVGIACFFLPSARLVLVLVVCLVIWMVISWSWGTTETWLHFAFGLFAATGLRIYSEFQSSKLESALFGAENEIEKRKRVEKALRESEERYSLAAQGSKDGLWDWHIEKDELYYSPRWTAMLDFDEDEIGDSIEDWFRLIHPEDEEIVRGAFMAHQEGKTRSLESECRVRRQDGSYLWVLIRGIAVRNKEGTAYRMAGSQTDIHERKLAEQELYYGAFHDPLTGLPNRVLFVERLKQALERRKRHTGYLFAVLFMDFDRFKVINDSLGHLMGDELLKATARRLEACVREVDSVARFGGDEFAILLDDVSCERDARSCADRIHGELKRPFVLGSREVFVTVSIGIVLSVRGYDKPEELLRDADTAMYRAKVRGQLGSEVFNPEMHTEAMASWNLENDLRMALRDGLFRLWYQPIISVESGDLIACEALIRWEHPKKGLLSPGSFLPTADEVGLTTSIGWWVLEEACKQVRRWQDTIPSAKDLGVNINVAGIQFSSQDVLQRIEGSLNTSGLKPNCLRLELTEDGLRQFGEASTSLLQRLKEKGIQLHLDDFGTGYSSLAYLHRLPLDTSKIDRSFVSGPDSRSGDREILRAMVNLIHDLGMEVVLEGVETERQLAIATDLGCEYAQGFLLAKPMSSEKFEEFLEDSKRRGEIHDLVVNS